MFSKRPNWGRKGRARGFIEGGMLRANDGEIMGK